MNDLLKKLAYKKEQAESILFILANNQENALKKSDVEDLAASVVFLANHVAEPIGDELDNKYDKIAPNIWMEVNDNEVNFISMKPGILKVQTSKISVPKSALFNFAMTEINMEVAKRGNEET